MRRLFGGLCLFLLLLLWPTAAYCAEAAELTSSCAIEVVAGRDDPISLLDRNRATAFRAEGDARLRLTCETPIAQFYMIWDTAPGPWTLTAEGAETTYGQYGFIHEYIALDTPSTTLEFTLPEEYFTLCDIYVFAAGEPPFWVEVWEPPLERADLLVLPTHADDEHLFFGGTLPYYAGERKLAVQVAYLTHHWGESYRPHELLFGLWEVGVRNYPIISDFPDQYSETLEQAEAQYGREEVTAYLTGLLRRFQPHVVVGHDLNGEYGHGAHMLNAHCLLDAAAASADESRYPESAALYGVWEVPKVYLHLYPENEIIMDWDMTLPSFGMTAYEVASAGYNHHKSQHVWFQMEHWGLYDCRKFGLAHTTVGLDTLKNDFFENTVVNVEPPADPEPEPEPEPQSTMPELEPQPAAPEPESLPESSPLPLILGGAAIILAALLVIFTRRLRR